MNKENLSNEEHGTAVTPPPFCHNDEPQQNIRPEEPSASPTLNERIAAMELQEDVSDRLRELVQGLGDGNVSAELLATLAQGITHDSDVQDADTTGYLRGRNEKIEAVMHPQPQDRDAETMSAPVFPRYCRRSIWD